MKVAGIDTDLHVIRRMSGHNCNLVVTGSIPQIEVV